LKAELGHVFAWGDERKRLDCSLHAAYEADNFALHDVDARFEQHGGVADGGRHSMRANFSDCSSGCTDLV
jgi:hypothetical protein